MSSVRALLRLVFAVVRLPVLAALALCAPFIRFVLGALTLLMLLSASVWALEKPVLSAPVLGLLACAFALAFLQVLYDLLVRALSR